MFIVQRISRLAPYASFSLTKALPRTRQFNCSAANFQSQPTSSAPQQDVETKKSTENSSAGEAVTSENPALEEDPSTPLPNTQFQAAQEQVSTSDVKTPVKSVQAELEDNFSPYRYVYPEFLPDPKIIWRNRIREKLERIDMLKRRANFEIPEFYVGSIMKVAVSDKYAVGKVNEFVGICIERGGCGLRAWFTLRNVIDQQGVEIRYEMYNPIMQSIQVLKLEKRLDESLRYLRDCPLEYSTFPIDMQPELRNPDALVPINTTMVRIKPKPWTVKWHLYGFKGIENLHEQINEKWELKKEKTFHFNNATAAQKYDLMKIYRATIPADEQVEIFSEISPQLAKLSQTLKKQKRKRTFVKPHKTA